MGEEGGLDQFLADLGTTDAKKKLSTGQVRNFGIWGISMKEFFAVRCKWFKCHLGLKFGLNFKRVSQVLCILSFCQNLFLVTVARVLCIRIWNPKLGIKRFHANGENIQDSAISIPISIPICGRWSIASGVLALQLGAVQLGSVQALSEAGPKRS